MVEDRPTDPPTTREADSMTDRRPTPAEVAAVYGPGVDIPPETLLLEAKMAHLAERITVLETANVELRRRLTDRDIAIAELQRREFRGVGS